MRCIPSRYFQKTSYTLNFANKIMYKICCSESNNCQDNIRVFQENCVMEGLPLSNLRVNDKTAKVAYLST